MNVVKINQWIDRLGETHAALLSEGANLPLREVFPGSSYIYIEPAPGLYVRFSETTKKSISLMITLHKTLPEDVVYEGELPTPYFTGMLQDDIRTLLGEPIDKSGPIIMPEPLGQTGGWETYPYDAAISPNRKVLIQYTKSMQVKGLVFRLANEPDE